MSDSNLASVAFQRETLWGQTPIPPALQLLRFTKEGMEHEKSTEQSTEIRPDRQRSESTQVGVGAKGGFEFELSIGSFDSFLEAALMGAWADVGGVQTLRNGVTRYSYTLEKKLLPGSFISFAGMMLDTLALNFASRKIVTGTTTFLGRKGDEHATSIQSRKLGTLTFAANAADGDTVTVGGKMYTLQAALTAGDGHVKIGATAAATIANLVAAINADVAGSGTGYAAATVANTEVTGFVGTVAGTLVVVEKFGGAVDTATTEVAADLSWGAGNLATAQAAYTAAATGLILTSSVNVGNILEGGAVVSGLKNLSLTVNNNLRGNDEIGRIDIGEVGLGVCAVSGKVDAYFRDRALLTKFIQHSASSLSFEVSRVAPGQVAGDHIGYRFSIPKLRWTKGMPTTPGQNADIMLPLEFEAEVGDGGYTVQVEKLVLP
jgi:hypothetical protein